MHSWKHVISKNAIFHCILSFSFFFFSFFTLNCCQNCHLFTNQWFIKSTTRFSKRSSFFSFISPCQYRMLHGMQEWGSFYASKPLLQYAGFRHNFWFFFFPWVSPEKAHKIPWSSRKILIFFLESNPEFWISALISMTIQMYAIIEKDEGQCN